MIVVRNAETFVAPREVLSQSCSALIALSVLSFLFLYSIWWAPLLTGAIGCVGYYTSQLLSFDEPNSAFISITALQFAGEVMLLLHTTSDIKYEEKNGWEVVCMLFGTLALLTLAYMTVRLLSNAKWFIWPEKFKAQQAVCNILEHNSSCSAQWPLLDTDEGVDLMMQRDVCKSLV
ncbi:hypothetical protein ACHHYP_20660 [Achlya hypogyna]|uniref:Uncharacterized protein n=1 Tax=Achlya hypogyna TaxID=1202772 RepID=A0A1V9YFS0_ACHHY|nr:hypothetical protein ACHHYP_20660 [Achlya hypogyna]